MTGIIDDAIPMPGGADSPSPEPQFAQLSDLAALREQAKGVLIFRYAVDALTAHSLLELWSAETGADVDAVARAVVHEICQGDRQQASDPHLVRWLEDRLRHEVAGAHQEPLDAR